MKLALNPFEGKKPGRKAEQEQKIEFELDEKVERVLGHYRLEITQGLGRSTQNWSIYETLKPVQIDMLLQRMIKETPKKHLELSVFLSKIIQNSYKKGYNNFTLTTKETELKMIGSRLRGMQENPIQITIRGNPGTNLGWKSENCEYNIQSAEYSCGAESENCTYNIKGNAGYNCGANSANSTYNITGSVGHDCGSNSVDCTYNITGSAGHECGVISENCTYNMQGNIGDKCGFLSVNCAFVTPNKETYEKMLKDVEEFGKEGNKVEYTGK